MLQRKESHFLRKSVTQWVRLIIQQNSNTHALMFSRGLKWTYNWASLTSCPHKHTLIFDYYVSLSVYILTFTFIQDQSLKMESKLFRVHVFERRIFHKIPVTLARKTQLGRRIENLTGFVCLPKTPTKTIKQLEKEKTSNDWTRHCKLTLYIPSCFRRQKRHLAN